MRVRQAVVWELALTSFRVNYFFSEAVQLGHNDRQVSLSDQGDSEHNSFESLRTEMPLTFVVRDQPARATILRYKVLLFLLICYKKLHHSVDLHQEDFLTMSSIIEKQDNRINVL